MGTVTPKIDCVVGTSIALAVADENAEQDLTESRGSQMGGAIKL